MDSSLNNLVWNCVEKFKKLWRYRLEDFHFEKFKVNKLDIFAPYITRLEDFESPWFYKKLHYTSWFYSFYVEKLNWQFGKKHFEKLTWFSFFKKLLSRGRYKIEVKAKLLIALRCN